MFLSKNTIWKLKIATLFMMSVMFFVAGNIQTDAAINPMVKFEGKVTNTDGTELADGVYNFSFGIYTQPTGGAAIWSEDLTAANMFSADIDAVTRNADNITYHYTGASATSTLRVGQYLFDADTEEAALIIDFDNSADTVIVASGSPLWTVGDAVNNRPYVIGGVIDINLGAVGDLTSVDFNQQLYLQVTFNGEVMQPRKNVAAVFQAFEAARLDGKSGNEFAGLADNETVTGEWNFNNIVSISTTSDETALSITQNGDGNIVEFNNATGTAFAVLNDGRVQIGNYYFPSTHGLPGYVLKTDLNGNLYWSMDFAGSGGGAGQFATSTDPTYGDYIYESDTALDLVVGNNILTGPADTRLEVEGLSWLDTIGVSAQNQLRFYDADSSNYFALRATGTLAGNFVLTLPAGLGTAGQALLTDANGNLSWGSPSGFVYVNAGTTGQFPYYANNGSTLSATSSIFLAANGNFGVGTSTPAQLFSVGTVAGNQFLVNSTGQVVGGTWAGNAVGPAYGGTGTTTAGWTGLPFVTGGAWSSTSTLSAVYGGTGFSSYSSGDLLYAGNATTLAKLGIGSTGQLLVVSPAGIPSWVSTSSLNIDAGNMTGIIDTAHGGTGQNFSGATGFLYLAGGVASASNTIAIVRTDLAANAGIVLTDNRLSLDTTGNWSGTFDNQEGSYYLNAVNLNNFTTPFAWALSGTTTSALAEGNNQYWTNQRFDTRLAATTSLPNLTTLGNLATVGTITAGTWNGNIISVAYGGTGSSTLAANGLLYGNGTNAVSTTGQGPAGYILQSVAGIPTWVATTSLGINIGSLGGVLPVNQGGTGTTTATGARVNLGLVIGADILAYNSGLSAIAGMASTTDGLFIVGSAGGWASQGTSTVRTTLGLTSAYDNQTYLITSQGANGQIWMSDGVGAGTWTATGTLGLLASSSIGATVQGYDPTLAALAAFNSNGLLFQTGADTFIATGTNGLSVAYGGTGSTTLANNGLIYGNGTGPVKTTGAGTAGYILQSVAGVPTWVATTSLGINFGDTAGVLDIAKGGTGATTAAGARTNLGLAIGADVQAYDLGLSAISGLASTTDGLFIVGSAGGWIGQGTSTVRNTLGLANAFTYQNYFITSDGTNGQVWLSDGNGAGGWQSTSSLNIDLTDTSGILSATRGGTGWNSGSVTGIPFVTGGLWGSTTTLSVIYGGTGSTTLTLNGLLYGNGTGPVLSTGQGISGYILQSVGGVPTWVSTTSLGIDFNAIGGILPIVQGGTGADNASSAIANLGLSDIYNLGINATGTTGWLWQSDGIGRGHWVATTSLGFQTSTGNGYDTLVGTTTATTDGSFATSTLVGYQAANDMCNAEYPGSHFCRTHEILYTIQFEDITNWGIDGSNAWIAEGPPGYTYDSNDCNGYTDANSTKLGAFWLFNKTGGGAGWLVNCAQVKALACCKVQ